MINNKQLYFIIAVIHLNNDISLIIDTHPGKQRLSHPLLVKYRYLADDMVYIFQLSQLGITHTW